MLTKISYSLLDIFLDNRNEGKRSPLNQGCVAGISATKY